jgi:flagellar hook-associated protein 2
MATTSSLGIGTGVDLQSMLTKLMAAERTPIDVLTTRITAANSKISLYGTLKSKLDALKTAADTLQFPSRLSAITATSSDTTVVGATADFTAAAGSYAINVTQLATAQKSFSKAYDTGTSFGQGTLDFVVAGTAHSIALTDQSSYTLQEILGKINDADIGVTATVISGTDGERLILTGSQTGASNSFSFTTTIAAPDSVPAGTTQDKLDVVDTSASLASSTAQDAAITIDGVPTTSTTNSISSAVSGLTFSAVKLGTATVTVQSDSAKIVTAAQALVDSYNAAVTLIKSNSNYDLTTKTSQAFNADSAARSVLTALSNTRTTVPTELGSATIQSLAELGISVQQTGLLTLDTTTLKSAISTSASDVTQTLGAYGKTFSDSVGAMLDSGGLVTNRVDSLNTSVRTFKDSQAALEIRVAAIEKRYRAQFTALDKLVSSMQNTSSYLTQQLAALAK